MGMGKTVQLSADQKCSASRKQWQPCCASNSGPGGEGSWGEEQGSCDTGGRNACSKGEERRPRPQGCCFPQENKATGGIRKCLGAGMLSSCYWADLKRPGACWESGPARLTRPDPDGPGEILEATQGWPCSLLGREGKGDQQGSPGTLHIGRQPPPRSLALKPPPGDTHQATSGSSSEAPGRLPAWEVKVLLGFPQEKRPAYLSRCFSRPWLHWARGGCSGCCCWRSLSCHSCKISGRRRSSPDGSSLDRATPPEVLRTPKGATGAQVKSPRGQAPSRPRRRQEGPCRAKHSRLRSGQAS